MTFLLCLPLETMYLVESLTCIYCLLFTILIKCYTKVKVFQIDVFWNSISMAKFIEFCGGTRIYFIGGRFFCVLSTPEGGSQNYLGAYSPSAPIRYFFSLLRDRGQIKDKNIIISYKQSKKSIRIQKYSKYRQMTLGSRRGSYVLVGSYVLIRLPS